jgi:hypothetical protein
MRAKRQGKGDKGQAQGSKAGRDRAQGQPGGRARGQPRDRAQGQSQGQTKGQIESRLGLPSVPIVPGIMRSWEDFSESALRDYLEAAIDQISEDLDEQEQAFRSRN